MSRRDRIDRAGHTGQCERCGKRIYPSGKSARATAKTIPGTHLHAYRCPHALGWHLGHLPDAVRHGELGKDEYLARREIHAQRRRGVS